MTTPAASPPAPCHRVFLPVTKLLADANSALRHPAERSSWIWHPARQPTETAVLRFRLRFTLQEAAAPLLHVTADQRFQLRCDGRDITFGPDRCDLEHWTVQSIALPLSAGAHELEALAWFIRKPDGTAPPQDPATGEILTTGAAARAAAAVADQIRAPMAQITWRGGFLLHAEGVPSTLLNTGEAPWTVEDLSGAVAMENPVLSFGYLDVGPSFAYDLGKWRAATGNSCPAAVVMPPLVPDFTGVRRPGWCLHPANLPEQERAPWTGGQVRALRPSWDETPVSSGECADPAMAAWQALFQASIPLTVPASTEVTVFWDLENYRCGYPVMELAGGEGAEVEWAWAEAFFEAASPSQVNNQTHKGNRNEIVGKVFLGFPDRWQVGPSPALSGPTPALWWRCGRYVRVRVRTAAAPLTLKKMSILTTGFPLGPVGRWQSSDAGWDRVMPLFERAFRCAGHETWTDTPYYEQMCYVGDNVLVALCNYAWFAETRLSRRSVELYEWSRRVSGFVGERWPTGWRQESPTFSLLWPAMVRDYAWWRDDAPFVRAMLPGIRGVLAEFDGIAAADGLLHALPGWPFVDWVPEWSPGAGCGPGVREGDSSIVNLQWVLALQAAAQVEAAFGDARLAARHRELGQEVFARLLTRYWDARRGLLLDTTGNAAASEHAQMFALLTGWLDAEKTRACLEALRRGDGLAKATIYSSFYVLDALYRHGQSDELHRRLDWWRVLPDLGFTNTPEMPEPTRSDSHPWGAHPAWHSLASVAGVRPAAPGFTRVRVAPCPGRLAFVKCQVAHPRGWIEVDLNFSPAGATGSLDLPPETEGEFVWAGAAHPLQPGRNEIQAGAGR